MSQVDFWVTARIFIRLAGSSLKDGYDGNRAKNSVSDEYCSLTGMVGRMSSSQIATYISKTELLTFLRPDLAPLICMPCSQ